MTARYEVQHPYAAQRDGERFGPWAKGETVELGPDTAAWVNRDSPGCLKPARAAGGGRQQPPAADRQHRGGANRSAI